ncbi:MAG: hypothetical protein KAJ95_10790, partial [Gammaproteobacteria bacterium]|nr:hypothetical protein [Gammaproteobacteria bacterium]
GNSMSNTITASVEFYFKGDKISASIDLDLDQYMQTTGKVPDLFPLLAKVSKIDFYSYEYEMMQTEDIIFSDAQGLLKEYVVNTMLDTAGFESAWENYRALELIQSIAKRNMGINDLQDHPELRKTLLDVYESGKKHSGHGK